MNGFLASGVATLVLLSALPGPVRALIPDRWEETWNRTMYNPRERTDRAIEAAAAGDAEAALAAAETAHQVAPRDVRDADAERPEGAPPPEPRVDPRVAFNTGTAHLGAGDDDRAVELLRQAAADADAETPDLAPTAHYNLGNAQLAAGDTAGAVASFKESLRREPDDAAAKHNLEVALRRLEEERRLRAKQPQETPGGDRQGEEEQGDKGGGDAESEDRGDSHSRPEDRGRGEPGDEGDRRRPQEEEAGAGGEPREPQDRALEDFEDQPDMTAEQARALLESVENLERRQRQQEAAELQRRNAEGRKDW